MAKNSKIKSIKTRPRSRINSLRGREILDSRGNPTVEVELETDLGIFNASVPSGVSKGKYEAVELRDGGKRHNGMGVMQAAKNINEIIAPKLRGEEVVKQKKIIDEILINLDGTKNKSKLGANAILGVSMAVCRAAARAKNLPLYQYVSQLFSVNPANINTATAAFMLPEPCFNVINGGAHAGNDLDFQEFMIVPQLNSFSENLETAVEIYHQLKNLIAKRYGKQAANLGDEGGFAPPMRASEEALDLILEAAKNLGYDKKIKIILDVAASQLFKRGSYQMKIGVFSREGLLNYYLDLIKKYPIIGLEDPFAEDDWSGWRMLMSDINIKSQKLLIIGDDLLATNPKRMEIANEKNACNGAIIKINQIGTVTEAIEAAKLAKNYGWEIIVSHRSGETNDDFISDLAVGISADYIKAGAPARGERLAKYNRLLRIEEELCPVIQPRLFRRSRDKI
jgi:enolase